MLNPNKKKTPLLFELEEAETEEADEKRPEGLPEDLYREDPPRLPEVPEPEVVGHYHELAAETFGTNDGPYLLGSCTMKYNPRLGEELASLPELVNTHPRQSPDQWEGWLEILGDLHDRLSELVGLPVVSLLPAAGAQGEWVGLRSIGEYFASRGEEREEVLVPDSAHGTNPASATMAGFRTVEVESTPDGRVDPEDLEKKTSRNTAALMLTNPNTLGLFESDIERISKIIREVGGKLYYDGANLNPLVGRIRPGKMGFDVVHLNLHKTFGAPHGMGGPGSGPVAFSKELAEFRPPPRLERQDGKWRFSASSGETMGRIRSFYGNLTVMVKALAYIRRMGGEGLARAGKDSVLAANYLAANMPEDLQAPYPGPCKHEFVVSCADLPISAADFSKRLIDLGIHPPTVYFPLVVEEALMIEPTENLTLSQLDRVLEAFEQIAREAEENPDSFASYPENSRISRPDETQAAREPKLCHPLTGD